MRDASEDRADLVDMARSKAVRAYGHGFAGRATALVGDTPLDVAAALTSGARSSGLRPGIRLPTS
jgi:phosphoglycolate phosphatase-like HAD superfamily hydrolase